MLKIKQLMVDLYGCEADLNDEDFLLATLESAAVEVGARVVKRIAQRFSPQGVSAILLLAETHLSIHTWPEHGYAAVDIFICGDGKDPHAAWGAIREFLKPESFEINEIVRTIGERHA
jgi:S-adenosylmethionine decarboxylase